MNRASTQNGSAFFIILIAIMMFAMLSYAVFQGSRGSGASLSADQARLAAQDIISYGDTMAKTTQTLRLRGCSVNQLDYTNSAWTTVGGSIIQPANPSAPASGCSVFKITDGNMAAIKMPMSYMYDATAELTPGNTGIGSARVQRLQVPAVGDTSKEEIYYYLTSVKRDVCLKINEILGVSNPNGKLPESVPISAFYQGSFSDNNTVTMTDPSGVLSGKTAFCLQAVSGSDRFDRDVRFYRVLLTR